MERAGEGPSGELPKLVGHVRDTALDLMLKCAKGRTREMDRRKVALL